MKRYYGIRNLSTEPLATSISNTPYGYPPLVSEDPPEDPIQEIFTRNLGIFAAGVFPSDRVPRMIGRFFTSRGISAKYSPYSVDH